MNPGPEYNWLGPNQFNSGFQTVVLEVFLVVHELID